MGARHWIDQGNADRHGTWLRNAKFSVDGRRVFTTSDDRTVRIWDAASGKETAKLVGHTGAIWALAVSPTGEHILSASADGTARIWDASTGLELRVLEGHDGPIEDAQ